MTDRLTEIAERVEKATPGPWFANVNDLIGGWQVATVDKPASEIDTRRREAQFPADMCSQPDATFIAHAREDIPWLLGEVRRLRRDLALAERARVFTQAQRDALIASTPLPEPGAALSNPEGTDRKEH